MDSVYIKIDKIKIKNFKKFYEEIEVPFNDDLNILIGDNEVGKSTILLAIDLVISGNKNRIYSIGLENLFNVKSIKDFLEGDKQYSNLPKLLIELYFKDTGIPELNGNNNSKSQMFDGIYLEILPNDEYKNIIEENLKLENPVFPFEYYQCVFKTFQGSTFDYSSKKVDDLFVNSSDISIDRSMKQYISKLYNSKSNDALKNKLNNSYRKSKKEFEDKCLNELNDSVNGGICFKLSNDNRYSLENNLVLYLNDLELSNMGEGFKCKLKVKSFIESFSNKVDFLLIEEPENHLSTLNMKELINDIINSQDNKQVFITTHNSYVCSRLGLKNIISLNNQNQMILKDLNEDTSKFFKKCTSNSILDFILSGKVILVEGAAEYILFEKFYEKVNKSNISQDKINIISVNGLSFLRYLEVADLIKNKVVVITDNDSNYDKNITKKYKDYLNKKENIHISYDGDNTRNTFEVCIANDNFELLKDTLSRQKYENLNDLIDFMINNKSECAYRILEKLENDDVFASKFKIPNYIKEGLEWIKS